MEKPFKVMFTLPVLVSVTGELGVAVPTATDPKFSDVGLNVG